MPRKMVSGSRGDPLFGYGLFLRSKLLALSGGWWILPPHLGAHCSAWDVKGMLVALWSRSVTADRVLGAGNEDVLVRFQGTATTPPTIKWDDRQWTPPTHSPAQVKKGKLLMLETSLGKTKYQKRLTERWKEWATGRETGEKKKKKWRQG